MRHFALITASILLLGATQVLALPNMDITTAKATLYNRQKTPRSKEFKARRISDLPSFDKLGIGSYQAVYQLNDEQKLMIWMYVETAPPAVDEVVLFITPASQVDLTAGRALKLLRVVYAESNGGKGVIDDFNRSFGNKPKGRLFRFFGDDQTRSLLPIDYDGGLYYLGDKYGYKISLNKGGFEVSIRSKKAMTKFLQEELSRSYPPAPLPTPMPTPEPTPTPEPPVIEW